MAVGQRDKVAKKKATKKRVLALQTWLGLNDVVRDADEQRCLQLLKEELRGKRRLMFLYRIHSRFNKLRAARERRELKG